MSVPDRRSTVADALEHLAGLSLREHSLESVLQTVVDLTKRVLPGDLEISVSLLVNGRRSTPTSTGQLALDLDAAQYSRDSGPCLHAARVGEVVEITDTATEERWDDYCRAAAEIGAGSSLSMPLSMSGRVTAALNVYSRQPHAFSEETKAAALRFVPFASVAVANVHAYQDARDMAGNLRIALSTRAEIDQAKGILIERFKLTPDLAFEALTSVSMRTNTKVRDVAEQLVLTGMIDVEPYGLGLPALGGAPPRADQSPY